MATDSRYAVPMHGSNYYSGGNSGTLNSKVIAQLQKPKADPNAGSQIKSSYTAKEIADMKKRPGAYTQAEKDSMNDFADKLQAQKDKGLDENGRPIRPEYKSATDSKGNLQKPYSISDKLQKIGDVNSIVPELDKRLAGVNQDTSGIDALKAEGLRTGPSAWLNNEMARNQAEEQYQLGDIGSAGAKAAADARAQLASRGGLSSGASERMASSSGKDIMAQQQNLRRNAALGRMSLSSQDELNRMQAISQLTPAQQAAAQFQLTKAGIPMQQLAAEQGMNRSGQVGNVNTANAGHEFDIGNALKSLGGQNDFNSTSYGQDMSAWGAGQAADAMSRAANQPAPGLLGSGGLLGTGLGTDGGIFGTGIGTKKNMVGTTLGTVVGAGLGGPVGAAAGGWVGSKLGF
jgi:hypothetical protein